MSFWIFLGAVNLLGLVLMWLDKFAAKSGKGRVREATLFLVALAGGGVGILLGMYLFHHKTKKRRFTIGIPVIILLWCIGIFLYFYYR